VGVAPNHVSGLGTAANDLFAGMYTAPAEEAAANARAAMARASAQVDILQGQGDILEGQTYGQAAALADRALFMTLGTQRTAAAGSGSTGGGSAGTILRSSVQQGALNRSVIQQ
jgi:hypothetical protein